MMVLRPAVGIVAVGAGGSSRLWRADELIRPAMGVSSERGEREDGVERPEAQSGGESARGGSVVVSS